MEGVGLGTYQFDVKPVFVTFNRGYEGLEIDIGATVDQHELGLFGECLGPGQAEALLFRQKKWSARAIVGRRKMNFHQAHAQAGVIRLDRHRRVSVERQCVCIEFGVDYPAPQTFHLDRKNRRFHTDKAGTRSFDVDQFHGTVGVILHLDGNDVLVAQAGLEVFDLARQFNVAAELLCG